MIIPEAIPDEAGRPSYPDVLVLQGLPGSGKTTWWTEYFKSALVLSADSFHYVDGVYKFDPKNQSAAHTWCLTEFIAVLQNSDNNERTVIVDNNNLTAAEIAPYMEIPKGYGRKAILLTFHLSVETCIRRQTHGVPIPDMMRKAQRFASESERLPPWWQREYIFSGDDGMAEASWVPSREAI